MAFGKQEAVGRCHSEDQSPLLPNESVQQACGPSLSAPIYPKALPTPAKQISIYKSKHYCNFKCEISTSKIWTRVHSHFTMPLAKKILDRDIQPN